MLDVFARDASELAAFTLSAQDEESIRECRDVESSSSPRWIRVPCDVSSVTQQEQPGATEHEDGLSRQSVGRQALAAVPERRAQILKLAAALALCETARKPHDAWPELIGRHD
jgi:hypothetical protein